jgi:hypothetical protein
VQALQLTAQAPFNLEMAAMALPVLCSSSGNF